MCFLTLTIKYHSGRCLHIEKTGKPEAGFCRFVKLAIQKTLIFKGLPSELPKFSKCEKTIKFFPFLENTLDTPVMHPLLCQ